jgi:hypothetical protein
MDPNDGCAHASCQTGAVWLYVRLVAIRDRTCPLRMTGSPLASPLTTLNMRMVLSEEQVASRLP